MPRCVPRRVRPPQDRQRTGETGPGRGEPESGVAGYEPARRRYRRSYAAATLGVRADVAELVDAHGSGPCGGNPVEVQVLSSAFSGLAEISASQPFLGPRMYRSDA